MTRSQESILRELAESNAEAELLVTYLDRDVGLVVRNGRDPRLAAALEAAIESLPGESASPASPGFEFRPLYGPEVKKIAHTRQDRTSRLAWLRQALKSGVYTGELRGVAGVTIGPEGGRFVARGDVAAVQKMLIAASDALRRLKSRSNRGLLKGPYWFRGVGGGVDRLLTPRDAPSPLDELFAEGAEEKNDREGEALQSPRAGSPDK